MSGRRQRDAYFKDVAGILAAEFEWDESTKRFLITCLEADTPSDGFPPYFQFICDNPASARFRLKVNPRVGPWALRMAFYPVVPNRAGHPDEHRAMLITKRLTTSYKRWL